MSEERSLECPRCKLPLSREEYEKVPVDICRECWGVWLDSGELETILESHRFQFSPEEKLEFLEGRAGTVQARGRLKPVSCPRCSARMERVYLDPTVYLVIDRCSRHGVWLDTGEIKAVQAMAESSKRILSLLLRKLKGLPPPPD